VVALVLLAFILITTGVIWRRTAGMDGARELEALRQQKSQLEALRTKLESDIRLASSRGVLAPIAERRLNMRVATDSQYVILARPPRPLRPPRPPRRK
jgi:hypothetical protein